MYPIVWRWMCVCDVPPEHLPRLRGYESCLAPSRFSTLPNISFLPPTIVIKTVAME